MNTLLLMMGGSGTRFGADRPKQYAMIGDMPVFSYIAEAADQEACIDRLVLVSHKDWLDFVNKWTDRTVKRLPYAVVEGGKTRSESVKNGLAAMAEDASEQDVVLIHDATHPYLDRKTLPLLIEAVQQVGGATLASKNYDTVYRVSGTGMIEKVEPRENIVAGASPEAFRFGELYRIYREASREELEAMTSAGAIALAHDIPMKVISTDLLNLKITYPGDMKLFELLCDKYFFEEEA